MIKKILLINGGGYGQTDKVHIKPSYNIKTTPMVLGGECYE